MKQSDLKQMIKGDILDGIFLQFTKDETAFYISVSYISTGKYLEIFGSSLTNNDGTLKTYTSIDRAVNFLRSLNYHGSIHIAPVFS